MNDDQLNDNTPVTSETAGEVKPKATRGKKAEAATAAGEQLFDITLHDSPEIPPNGQFIGINGKQYVLKPGVRVRVPASVLEVLDNAVHAVPELDANMRVMGMRNAPRLTYTLHRS